MNRHWKLAALGLLVSTLALADNDVLNKGTYNQNATNGAKTDPNGNAYTNDVNTAAWTVFPDIIANQLSTSVGAMYDSSQVYNTSAYRRLALALSGQFDSLSTIVRLAVQVRASYTTSSDSSSAFPWLRWPGRSTAAATDVDSTGAMFTGIYAVAQATGANTPILANDGLWPGEFIVKFNVAALDSTASGNGKFGAYPRTMYIPLQDWSGGWFSAPYTSVRVRIINGVRSRFKVRVDLIGMQ